MYFITWILIVVLVIYFTAQAIYFNMSIKNHMWKTKQLVKNTFILIILVCFTITIIAISLEMMDTSQYRKLNFVNVNMNPFYLDIYQENHNMNFTNFNINTDILNKNFTIPRKLNKLIVGLHTGEAVDLNYTKHVIGCNNMYDIKNNFCRNFQKIISFKITSQLHLFFMLICT